MGRPSRDFAIMGSDFYIFIGQSFEQFLGSAIICDGLFTYFVYAAMFVMGGFFLNERLGKWVLYIFISVIIYLSLIVLIWEIENDFILYCFSTMKSSVFRI